MMIPKAKSRLEEAFALQCRALKLPEPVREYRFCDRLWRFDFCWKDALLAVELQGGTFSGGGHTRGEGYENDCDKANRAIMLGWAVMRFTGKHVDDGSAVAMVSEYLQRCGQMKNVLVTRVK